MALEDAKNEVDVALTGRLQGQAYENVFSGVTSFLRRPYRKDFAGVDAVVTGIPFDQAVTNRPGTRLGPRAIREASAAMAGDPPFGWEFDVLSEFAIADAGDMAFDYATPADVPGRIEAHAGAILDAGPALFTLGGDHSITLPLLRAHAARYGPLSLVQFDAHSDTWPDDDSARVDHGTIIYKAVKEGLIDRESSVQIGIRTKNPDHNGIPQLGARSVHIEGPVEVARQAREIVGNRKAYLTFDIDALDPSAAPGTGTPVWGGLTSGQAAIILRDLAGINVIGGDVVEVSPPFDAGGITAIAGAHVALEILCLWGAARRGA